MIHKQVRHELKLICLSERLKYYSQIIDPLREHDRELLRSKINQLKQSDVESWACGETLERIVNLLSICEQFTKQTRVRDMTDIKKIIDTINIVVLPGISQDELDAYIKIKKMVDAQSG